MATMQDRALEKLNSLYEIRNAGEVFAYLAKYPALESILIQSHAQIRRLFGEDAEAYMKPVPDMEEDFETLCVYIASNYEISEANEILHRFDEWFITEMPRYEGDVSYCDESRLLCGVLYCEKP